MYAGKERSCSVEYRVRGTIRNKEGHGKFGDINVDSCTSETRIDRKIIIENLYR